MEIGEFYKTVAIGILDIVSWLKALAVNGDGHEADDNSLKSTVHDRLTRSSATAEKQRVSCPHEGGLGPPAHSPAAPLATPMRMVESETRNKRTSTKRTLR